MGPLQGKALPWLQLPHPVASMKISPMKEFLAYEDADHGQLHILNLKLKKVMVTLGRSHSFFWSPDGYRLIFEEDGEGSFSGVIKIYDCKTRVLQKIALSKSGSLTWDPSQLKFSYMSEENLREEGRLQFPHGPWEVFSSHEPWFVYNQSLFRQKHHEKPLAKAIQSFHISFNGEVLWQNLQKEIWLSRKNGSSEKLASGQDPQWNDQGTEWVYACQKFLGSPKHWELCLGSLHAPHRILTFDGGSKRWPQWFGPSQWLYTIERSMDLWVWDSSL